MSQLSLKELQTRFIDYVYGDQTDPSDFVLANDQLSASERLAVYRGSVMGNLTLALGDIFPVTKSLLGEEFFDAMALRYIKGHPSLSSGLDDYGEELASFTKSFPPLADLPYIPDVVEFEWLWHRVFHEQDQGLMDFEKLGQLSPEAQADIQFTIKKALRLFESPYPIVKIWQNHHPRIEHEIDDQEINLDEGGGSVLIWRQGLEMRTDPLEPAQAEFLQWVREKIKFGTICELWGSKYPENDIATMAGQAAQLGWFVDFELKDPSDATLQLQKKEQTTCR